MKSVAKIALKIAFKTISIMLFIILFCAALVYGIFCFNFGGAILNRFAPAQIQKFSDYLKEKNSGLELVVEKPHFKTSPRLNLKIDFDSLKLMVPKGHEPGKRVLLALGKTSGEIKITALISKKIIITKFDTNSLAVDIFRDKKGIYEFEKYFNPKNKMVFKINFENGKFNLDSYKIALKDDFKGIKSTIMGEQFALNKSKNDFEFKTKGEITTYVENAKKPAISTFNTNLKTKFPIKNHLTGKDFNLDAEVNNVDISQYSDFFKSTKGVKGIFDIKISTVKNEIKTQISAKNFEITDKKYEIATNGVTKIDAVVILNGGLNGDFVEIKSLNLKNEELDIGLRGKISNYKSKNAGDWKNTKIDIDITGENCNGKAIIALLPNLIPTTEPDLILKLKKYSVDGTLRANGRAYGQLKKINIDGDVKADNVTILNNKFKIPPANVGAKFKGENVEINARAFLDKNKYADVNGLLNLHNSDNNSFKVKSTKNLDMKKAQLVVLPISDTFGFSLGPVPIMDISGLGEIDIRTKGNRDSADIYGFVEFDGAKVSIEGFETPIEAGFGKIKFMGEKILFNNIKAKINTAPIEINGIADTSGNVDMKFYTNSISNKDVFRICKDNFKAEDYKKIEPFKDVKFLAETTLGFKHKFPKTKKIQMMNLKDLGFWGTATGINSPATDVKFNSGKIYLKNNKLFVDKLDIDVYGANLFANLTTEGVMDTLPIYDPKTSGTVTLKSFPLAKLGDMPPGTLKAPFLENFNNFDGSLNGVLYVNKNKLAGKVDLAGISAVDTKKNIPIKVNMGTIEAKSNKLNLNTLNLSYGSIPVYFDAVISELYNAKGVKPLINGHFSTSLSEADVDKFINTNLIYPIKVKGEVALKGMMKGNTSDYTVYLKTALDPNNDISYMGANFGDTELKREIRTNINFKNNIAKVNNFEYLKYVSSQNNKLTPVSVLRAFGNIVLTKDKVALQDFKIKTETPATARIFNIMFKKSILKQGQFSCDLTLNGVFDESKMLTPDSATNLKMLGNIDFTDINIPIYNSKIRDARLNFKNDVIEADFSGRGFESDVKITAQIQNSFRLPIVARQLNIASEKMNIGKIIDELTLLAESQKGSTPFSNSKESIVFGPKDLIVENGTFSAAEVNLYDINAKNLVGKFIHLNSEPFNFYDTKFNIAGGEIVNMGAFDFETTKLTLSSEIKDCEANTLSQSFLGIANQLFGKTNGEIFLTGSKLNTADGLKTVEAKAMFDIKQGKMPKLGSMEYLLRAGNIYKSGILGLTLNNIIDVLIPYKTGEFDTIKGQMLVQNGVIEQLEISSKGENLSIFAHGKYDLVNHNADIQVLGRLSKKISNLLGPIGNASVNSLLTIFNKKEDEKAQNEIIQNINKIPLIEISGSDYRLFAVKITGDLNKENYVKTFNWVD